MSSDKKPTPHPDSRTAPFSAERIERSFTHTNPDPTTNPPVAGGVNPSQPESTEEANNTATANTGTAATTSDDS